MPEKDPKREALRQQGTLNPRPGEVIDKLFAEDSFFDPRDLVQVKYEMLRRVQSEHQSVSEAAAAFGFSRPSFYQAQSAFEQDGLAGLVPHKRGPKRAHKLTEEVLTFIVETRQQDRAHRASTKHRARVAAPSKKTPLREPNHEPVIRLDLVASYEQLRGDATTVSARGHEGLGLALFLRRGMKAWMQAWSQCSGHVSPQVQARPAALAAPVSFDVRMQVATVLAGIILSLHQEATL